MTPQTVTSLALLVAFILPGFVTVLIQERTFGRNDAGTQLDRLLRTVYYSGWSYLFLAIVAVAIPGLHKEDIESFVNQREEDPAELVLWATGVLLVPSVVIAGATQRWSDSDLRTRVLSALKLNARHRVDSAWDYIFFRRSPAYVRVTLTSGQHVLGYYGSLSFAAYARDNRDLYLEHTIQETADGWFGEAMPNSRGVWISTDDVVSIEFYAQGDEREDSADSSKGRPEAGGGSSAADGDDNAPSGSSAAPTSPGS